MREPAPASIHTFTQPSRRSVKGPLPLFRRIARSAGPQVQA